MKSKLFVAALALALVVACNRSHSVDGASSASTSVVVDPKSAATNSAKLDIDTQETIRLNGELAGTTRPASEVGRLTKIDELFDKAKPLAKQDTVFAFSCGPDVVGAGYMSALLTVGSEGFSSIDVETPNGPVRAVIESQGMIDDDRTGAALSDRPYAIAKIVDPYNATITWMNGGQSTNTEVRRNDGPKAWSSMSETWKQHRDTELLLVAPDRSLHFGEFAAILSVLGAARAEAHKDARIMVGVKI